MNRLRPIVSAAGAFVFGLVFPCVPAVIVVLVIHDLAKTHDWMNTSVPASAIVEERHEIRHDDKYEATVLFTAIEGNEQGARVRGKDIGKPGSSVDIRYDPHEPSRARLAPSAPFWLGPSIAIVVSTLFLSITVPLPVVLARDAFREARERSGRPPIWET